VKRETTICAVACAEFCNIIQRFSVSYSSLYIGLLVIGEASAIMRLYLLYTQWLQKVSH